LRAPQVAVTLWPASRAICTAKWPTPPEAAVTSTFLLRAVSTRAGSSKLIPVVSSARSAVTAAIGRQAPSATDTSGGLSTVRDADATAYSASPPPFCNGR
jgi:hypothetical protein